MLETPESSESVEVLDATEEVNPEIVESSVIKHLEEVIEKHLNPDEHAEDFKFNEAESSAIKNLEEAIDNYAHSNALGAGESPLIARDRVSGALLELLVSFPDEYEHGLNAAINRVNPVVGILHSPEWEIATTVVTYEATLLIRASTFKEIGEQILSTQNALAWLNSYCPE